VSVEAITWALKQPIPQSSAKFVLVVLANQANSDTSLAFPSLAYMADATGQDRKTVIRNLARLCEWKLIEDTGERHGRTKQVIVYRLLMSASIFDGAEKRNGSEIGTGTKNGTVPKRAPKSTVFPRKESQKRDTEPSLTVSNQQQRGMRGTRLPDDFVPNEEVKSWAKQKHQAVDLAAALDEFRDYWKSVPGSKGESTDWQARFRCRVRDIAARNRDRAPSPPPAARTLFKPDPVVPASPETAHAALQSLSKKFGTRATP